MDEEAQLLATGRVIAAARKIESRLVDCGGSGSGLREKVESLGSRLSPDTVRLINHIGGVRNRFAHESNVELRPDELQLFEEAAEAVLEDLDLLASGEGGEPEKPKRSSRRKPAEDAGESEEPEEPELEPEDAEKALPPWSSPVWSCLPGPHLVYAVLTAWNAFGDGKLHLLLFLAELLSLTTLGFSVWLESVPLAVAGGCLFAVVWLCGLLLGLRGRKAGEELGFSPVPLLNLFWFLRKVIVLADPARLVVAVAILGVWLAAIQLAVYGEYTAAIIAALVSWFGALLDALLYRFR